MKKYHLLLMTSVLCFVLLTSCSENAHYQKTITSSQKPAKATEENWESAIAVEDCGPTDGIMHQIRIGWLMDKKTNSPSQQFPSMTIAYEKTGEDTHEIYSTNYCITATECETIAAEDMYLKINPSAADGSFTGTYEMKLASKKSVSGQFKVAKDAKVPLMGMCG